MRNRTVYIILVLLASRSLVARGQTYHLADQFLLNRFQTNPALAGTQDGTLFTLMARQQWVGLEGAPASQSFRVLGGLRDRTSRYNPRGFLNQGVNSFSKVGLGGGIYNFSYGAINHIGIHFDYAYHVLLGNGRLGMGLSPLYHQFLLNKSSLILPDGDTPDDAINRKNLEMLHFLDANIGFHYTLNNFFAGISAIQLFNSRVYFGDFSFESQDQPFNNPYLARTIYGYAGYILEAGENLAFEPSVLVKHNGKRGMGGQVNLVAYFAGSYQAGISWRYRESASFFIGIQFNNLAFKYLFESPFGSQITGQLTTHQVLLGYTMD